MTSSRYYFKSNDFFVASFACCKWLVPSIHIGLCNMWWRLFIAALLSQKHEVKVNSHFSFSQSWILLYYWKWRRIVYFSNNNDSLWELKDFSELGNDWLEPFWCETDVDPTCGHLGLMNMFHHFMRIELIFKKILWDSAGNSEIYNAEHIYW